MRTSGSAILLCAILLAAPALAQQNGTTKTTGSANANSPASMLGLPTDLGTGAVGSDAGNGPVEIDASDGVEWNQDQKVYIARGNARAARGDTTINADSLVAHYRGDVTGKTDIYMVEAVGHVVITSKDSKIVGDKAVYNLDNGSAVLTGHGLRASSKDQTVTARDSMEYWEKQNAVIARGGCGRNRPRCDPPRRRRSVRRR